MEILTVTLFVCMILAISYVLFGKEINRKKKEECEKNLYGKITIGGNG